MLQTNNLIRQLAEEASALVWLGLKCSDTSPGHCLWDDGLGAATPYNAFYQGWQISFAFTPRRQQTFESFAFEGTQASKAPVC